MSTKDPAPYPCCHGHTDHRYLPKETQPLRSFSTILPGLEKASRGKVQQAWASAMAEAAPGAAHLRPNRRSVTIRWHKMNCSTDLARATQEEVDRAFDRGGEAARQAITEIVRNQFKVVVADGRVDPETLPRHPHRVMHLPVEQLPK